MPTDALMADVKLVAGYVCSRGVAFIVDVDFPDDDKGSERVHQTRPGVHDDWSIANTQLIDVLRASAVAVRQEVENRFIPPWLQREIDEGSARPIDVPEIEMKLPLPPH